MTYCDNPTCLMDTDTDEAGNCFVCGQAKKEA